jgi:transcriptional regulator with XRE-family HTH domain
VRNSTGELTSLPEMLGAEIRRAREAAGFTRPEVASQLSLHPQTIAGYERGTTELSASGLIDLCELFGVPAPDVMARAMQRARIGLDTIGIQIDLYAVIGDTAKRSPRPSAAVGAQETGSRPGKTWICPFERVNDNGSD